MALIGEDNTSSSAAAIKKKKRNVARPHVPAVFAALEERA